MKSGIVYLTGGGCGDPALITVKGAEMLSVCDALVYDALVNPEFLALTREDCERIYVGKRAANHALPQDEINALLVRLGQEGKTVVRLKGGDPYVFGRGGEEGEALYDAGVSFEVIPGITSVIGGLAYAGIPITHRDCASSFQVVTGHLKDETSDLDWPVLAKSQGTLVFLMGMKNLKAIADSLMENGMDPEKPAAVVYRASTPSQRVAVGTLKTIYDVATEMKMTAPSLIVVGDVVTKRPKLRFFDTKPFFGKTFVVTRSRSQASSTVAKIHDLGGRALMVPAIRIEPIDEEVARLHTAIEGISAFTHLIFTSVNGVEIFYDELAKMNRDSRALAGLFITAIGSATADALKDRGVVADLVPEKYVGEELIQKLRPLLTAKDRVLLPRSKNARPTVADALAAICPVEEIPIYQTIREDDGDVDLPALLAEGAVDYITFTSSTTAQYFVEKLGEGKLDSLGHAQCVSIGPITSKKMESLGLPVDIEASTYTIDGMLDAVKKKL